MVRCFEDPDIAHVTAELDPLGDSAVIDLELVLADLATVERRQEKVRTIAKAQPRQYAAELDILAGMQAHLESGHPAGQLPLSPKEAELTAPLNLLTAKPRLYIANVGEDDLPGGGPLAQIVRERAADEGAQVVVLCAQLESELAGWPNLKPWI